MDAIIIFKLIVLLTLLIHVRTKDVVNSTERQHVPTPPGIFNHNEPEEKLLTPLPLQYDTTIKHESTTKNRTTSNISLPTQQHPTNDLPKPLKLRNNIYDYDESTGNGTTIYTIDGGGGGGNTSLKDEPRRLKHKSDGLYNTRLKAALNMAAKQGLNAMIRLYEKTEPEMMRKGEFLEPNHPGAQLSKFSEGFDGTENSAKAAYAALIATKYFQKTYKLQADDLGRQAPPPKISFRRTPLEGLCPPREPPRCLPAAQRYRTHDGTCNNMKHVRWGSALMPFNRFLPPEYGDGIDTVRGSVDGGGPLSSARFVSLLVHGSRESESPVTLMLAQWGQLIDHDVTSTAQPRSVNGSVPRCCGADDFHPSCLPIKVPLDDPWLAPLNVRCLEFLRSAPAQRRDCVLSWREQTNQVTSYLDASPVYSSNARTSDFARVFRNGVVQFGRGNPDDDVCLRGALGNNCVRAGDGRSGEQPGLLAMHHVWVGEHNRIALDLSEMNPHWSDEKVYQEARRIVGAMFQHITYREFLPLIVGREVCKLFELELLSSGHYQGYDPAVNPTVANSFGAAAFRFGHSLIQSSYMRCDKNHNLLDNNVPLHSENTHGDMETAGSLHRLLRGLATQKAQIRDEFITAELTNHLFQSGSFPFGLDLAAINIQRGRDHGIPSYTRWREPCGLSPIENWQDLEKVVGPASVKRISHAYRSVHDIDLFVGGISERPVIGGLVGPTFACIIAQQFSNLRKGDRFWYENSGFESSFTPAQLHSIRRVSLSQVICRTLGGGTLQPHVFIPHDVPGNERAPCGIGSLVPIDLLPWLEEDPFNPHRRPPLRPVSSNPSELRPPTSPSPLLLNRIDIGPKRPPPLTDLPNNTTSDIHDKLDFHFPPKFTSTEPPRRHALNKIDNKKRKTTVSPNKNVKDFTTRRTVIINNIPLILRRSADPFSKHTLDAEARSDDSDLFEPEEKTGRKGHDTIYVQINRINSTSPFSTTNKNKTNKEKSAQGLYAGHTTKDSLKTATKLRRPLASTDEYEIEINIRQTNNQRHTSQYYHSDVPSRYDDFSSLSTPFSYSPSTYRPFQQQTSDYRPFTKPPKIIYLHDDDYTTSTTPGLLQTFFMVGSNSILDTLQKPAAFLQNSIFGGGANSGSSAALSSSSNAANTAPIHHSNVGHGGLGSASSSSSSTNNIFNINIQPSASSFDLSDAPPLLSSPGSYGLHSASRRPSPMNYDETRPSNPFSNDFSHQLQPSNLYYNRNRFTTNTRRPFYRPTDYYPRTKDAMLLIATSKNASSIAPVKTLTDSNDFDQTTYTSVLSDNSSDSDEYYDDSDMDLGTKFDNDGYLRPEHMIFQILTHNSTATTTTEDRNEDTKLSSDDDFILPILRQTETESRPTTHDNASSYYDAIPRRPASEILAEDYDYEVSPLKTRQKPHKNPPKIVPFAPLNVLTKPERPDNWVIFDEPRDQNPLPDLPSVNVGDTVSLEYPRPIQTQRQRNETRRTG